MHKFLVGGTLQKFTQVQIGSMAVAITPKGREALVNILPTKKTELISEFCQLYKENIQIISENRQRKRLPSSFYED